MKKTVGKAVVGLFAVLGLAVTVCAWDQVNTSVDGLNVKGGTLKIDGTAVTATAAELSGVRSSIEVNGDITLANDETIDNATDAKVRVTYNDDAAVLGELILESDNASASMADNDLVSLIGKAYDDTTNKTEFASIDLKFDDVTDSTEDGSILLKGFINGTERTLATFAAATTVGAAQSTLALTSSDWAIDATGAMTGIGAITADGTITANGALTANGVTTLGDGGDTVAVNSSDWDIGTTGDMTGIGAITADGKIDTSSANGIEADKVHVSTNGTSAGYLSVLSTQLVFISGAVTNVLDADITTP